MDALAGGTRSIRYADRSERLNREPPPPPRGDHESTTQRRFTPDPTERSDMLKTAGRTVAPASGKTATWSPISFA